VIAGEIIYILKTRTGSSAPIIYEDLFIRIIKNGIPNAPYLISSEAPFAHSYSSPDLQDLL